MSALLQTLALVCPACDLYHPAGSSQCRECGTPFAASKPSARPALVPPAQAASAPTTAPTTAPTSTAPPPATTPSQVPVSRRPTPPEPEALGASPLPATQSFPPGMRPSARTQVPAAHAPPAARAQPPAPAPEPAPPPVSSAAGRPAITAAPPQPIPASELLRKAQQGAQQGAPPARPASGPAPSRFGITVLKGTQPGQRFRLGGAGCMVGRQKGAIVFPDDVHLAAHHATLLLKDGKLFIRDESTLSGVFVSLGGTQELLPVGGYFCAGARLFRYVGKLEAPRAPAAGAAQIYGAPVPSGQPLYGLEEILEGGRAGRATVTPGPLLTIGQQHCDLSYPQDASLAARHCELTPGQAAGQLRDLSGGLGTFVRIPAGTERLLQPGDRVRLGQQILQVDLVG